MTAPNPLVAERQDTTTAITGIGIAESAVDVYNGISSGSWVEGGLGLAGGGLEALGVIVDPVGTLVSYGVAWLMEHVKPLSDALDWLAGDPDTIASYAQTWRNVAQAVAAARTDFDTAVRTDTAAWTGAAGDAYRAYAARQSERYGAAGTAAETVGTVVETVGVLVGVVREIVRDLVADCVATLIARIPQWLAEIAGTLGLATPHVVASAVALISRWVARIADVIRKLVRSIENLRPLLRRLDEIWRAIRGGTGDLPRGGSRPNGTSPDTGAPGTRLPDDAFARLSPDEQRRVAQSEVDQHARTFDDDAAAEQYGADHWNDYAGSLPPDQRRALFDYTSDPPHHPSYQEINAYLRGQDPGSPQVRHAVDQIDQALAGRPVPEDVVVSRGTGLSHVGMDPQDMVGQTFTERAYVSTSLGDPADAFAHNEAILHLRVPAGTPGIWVEDVAAYGAGERELLLGRGLEYRADRVVFEGGQWHIYGEYLPVR